MERAACRRLFRGPVKGILDQSQRRIKTSAPHFTSISPTLLEHCASAVEVNKGWLFVPLHTATHSSLTYSISSFFPPISCLFFVSSLTVTPLFAFPLCLLLDVKLAHTTPFQSSPIHHILSGIPGFTQLSNGIRDRFWAFYHTCAHVQCWGAGWKLPDLWSLFPSSPCFSQPQFSTLSWSRAFSLRSSVIIFNVESALGSVPSLLMKLCPGPRTHSDIKKFLVYQLFCDLWVHNNSNQFLLSCIKHLNI